LFPIKNDWLSAFLAVNQVTANSKSVYAIKIERITIGLISESFGCNMVKKTLGKKD